MSAFPDGPVVRPLNLPQAPVFKPPPEEFADPLRYIASIRSQAEQYGICKIIPPDGWAPPFAIDKQSFRFTTNIQAIHELQERLGLQAQQEFHEDLKQCMLQEGKAFKKPPVFSGKEIDLYKMYKAVHKRGGYAAVTDDKKWKDIVRILQVRSAPSMLSACRKCVQCCNSC